VSTEIFPDRAGGSLRQPAQVDWKDPDSVERYAAYLASNMPPCVVGIDNGTTPDTIRVFSVSAKEGYTAGIGFDSSRLRKGYTTPYFLPLESLLVPAKNKVIQFVAHGVKYKFISQLSESEDISSSENVIRVVPGGFEFGKGIKRIE